MDKRIIIGIIIFMVIFVLLIYNYTSNVAALNDIEIQFIDLNITEAKLTHSKLNIIVNITNPTWIKISDLSSNFKIFISKIYIGHGNFSKVTIPSNSYQLTTVKITIYYEGLSEAALELIKDLISGKKITLTLDGDLNEKIFFGLITISKNFNIAY